jgi:hypothetical protein
MNNNSFLKRQKELKRKEKQKEKEIRKAARKSGQGTGSDEGDASLEGLEGAALEAAVLTEGGEPVAVGLGEPAKD